MVVGARRGSYHSGSQWVTLLAPTASNAMDAPWVWSILVAVTTMGDVVPLRDVAADHYTIKTPAAVTTTSDIVLSKYDLELWIDKTGLVRRVRSMNYTRAQAHDTPPTPAETIEQTFEFFDFGVQADIQPPPADQVTEMPFAPSCAEMASSTTTTDLGILSCLGHEGTSVP